MEDDAIKSKKMRKQRREGQKLLLPSFILRSYTLALLASNIVTDVTCLAINSNHPNNDNFKPKAIISRKDGLSSTFIFRDDDKLLDYDKTQRSQQIINGNENEERSKITKKSYSNDSNNNQPLINKLKAGLRSTFLPSGYPQKTPKGYLSYSAWSWIQDLSTQLRGVLATQRVLEGVGVGREGATALSASLNFIVRDGCGMASTLVFTALSGSRFRSDVKRWRMFADLINDVGISLEVAATLVPKKLFLPMICVGNMCKAMCGVAAGACGGAINLHWSKGSDISDVNAKFGAQHTVTASLGLVFAALFARTVSTTSPLILWALYSALTLVHIVANMRCLKLIAFDYLNTSRMNILAKQFLDSTAAESTLNGLPVKNDAAAIKLDSPTKISTKEPLYFLGGGKLDYSLSPFPIRYGVSFDTFANLSGIRCNSCLERTTLDEMSSKRYLISLGNVSQSSYKRSILIALCADASPKDKAKAYIHALVFGRALANRGMKKRGKILPDMATKARNDNVDNDAMEEIEAIIKAEQDALEKLDGDVGLWNMFEKSARKAGWDLSKTELSSEGYEIEIG